ncbi:hypothetical protein ACET3X_008635 [Alternaria dauci]|uniref:Uncharacterized protein n=1 Tax=Alternaria dauci TaxID=48095 RepID=A0ABR3UAY2_9PLEO
MVEPCSESARASGPNAIKVAFKKSKDMLQPFYTSGLKNIAEPAYESEPEDEKPVVGTKATRSSFGDIMAQIRGSDHCSSHEKEKGDKVMKNEHERLKACADTPGSGVPASVSDSVDSRRLQKALQDADQHRQKDRQVSRKPLGVKDSNQLPALLSMKKRNHQTSQSEVRLCSHKTFVIYWDPTDPGNHNGSFISRIDDHRDKSDTTKHSCCNSRSIDVKEVAVEMASNIIRAFEKQEDDRVSGHDRRRKGIEPQRPPPYSVVLREVHNMYSQLHRDQIRKLAKTEKALDTDLDTSGRRKKLAEQIQLAAQQSRQRGGAAKNHNNDKPEADKKPSPSKRKKKTPKQIAEEKVARNKECRGLSDITRLRLEPLDRYKPSTVEEQKARTARVADQVRRERAAALQNTEPRTKSSQESNKFAIIIDVAEDDETPSSTREVKKVRRCHPARRVPDSDNESSEEEAKAKAALDSEPVVSDEEKQAAFLADIAVIERAQLAAQEMRKSTQADGIATPKTTGKHKATLPSDDVEKCSQIESRKSAATIEDSGEEADYPLCESSLTPPSTEVRHEFTIEADRLIRENQQQQVNNSEILSHAAAAGDEIQQAPKSPASPTSRGSKRKNEFPDCGEEFPASPSLTSSRPIKKAKQESFSKQAVSSVDHDQKTNVSPAATEEAVQDSVISGEVSSAYTEEKDTGVSGEDDGLIPITEQTEEEKDDEFDYLFEE